MSRFFNLHDPSEKKYIFNSFLVFVVLVELIILGATIIWQIDEGWFGGEVRVIPFPWQEYLVVAFLAPIVMIFLFGIIIRGFDLLNAPPAGEGEIGSRPLHRWQHRFSLVTYLMGLALVSAFCYGMIYPEKVLRYLKGLFSVLGLWGTYVVIGIIALSMLYFPISLLLRYRLAKQAMEYQYLLLLAERHGVIVDQKTGRLIAAPQRQEQQPGGALADSEASRPLLDMDHLDVS
ncbi:MAG: hypothetical protein ACUVRZ_09355 [Desulfobacca sp.]|uniref:hypothetical protein n=1 Tax=Desulfobacca sp. TaxID=2067990 RepID=UPI00404B9794